MPDKFAFYLEMYRPSVYCAETSTRWFLNIFISAVAKAPSVVGVWKPIHQLSSAVGTEERKERVWTIC